MVRTRKQLMKILFVVSIACLCFSYTRVSASYSTLIDSLSNNISDPGQVKMLITNYCDVVLRSSAFVQNEGVYNAKYSAFVYLLCSNVDAATSSNMSLYLGSKTFKELWFQDIVTTSWYQRDLCNPMNNDCNLSKTIPNLFNDIMNDYVNIKQASLYGLIGDYTDDNELGDVVNDYFAGYFGVAICDNDKNDYDKTCRMAKSYIKNVKNVLEDVRILDPKIILNMVPNDKDISCSQWSNVALNLFYCGFKDTWASMVSFNNLVYNELFYYRLFAGYYMIMIQQHPSLLIKNTRVTNSSQILKRFSSQYIWSKTALSLSLRMMRDMYMGFPFHVGFSMYQEDLDGFGKSLARIAPPIYTLYDKLRNVQSAE